MDLKSLVLRRNKIAYISCMLTVHKHCIMYIRAISINADAEMRGVMISLKRRMMFGNMLTFFIAMVMMIGLTACSRQTDSTADRDRSGTETVKNTQNETQEPQKPQETPVSSAASTLSPLEQLWIDSGKCGKDAFWTYDGNNKILEITGTGVVDQIIKESEDFLSFHGAAKYQVKEIRIGEGITALDAGPLFLNVCAEERVVKETEEKGSEIGEVKLFLPDSLEKIGTDTFDPEKGSYCVCVNFIRHIHIPSGVRYIEGGAFWGLGDDEVPGSGLFDEDGKVLTKKYIKKLKVTVDENNPYYTVKDGVLFTKDLKTLVYYPSEKKDQVYRIPKSVTHIKALAFARNFFLKEVILPKGLEEIGAGAFFHNRRLAKINLEQMEKLKRIRDYDGIKHKIGSAFGSSTECFLGEEKGSDAEYMDDAEGQNHFYVEGWSNLKVSYLLGTFEGTALKSISFPDNLKYVSRDTFSNCTHLKKISIGKSFAGEINPDQLWDKKGFMMSCLPVEEVNVSEKNKHYRVRDHILYSRDGKTVYQVLKSYRNSKLVLDKSVSKIARGACAEFTEGKLREVVALGNLKQISYAAFADSGIESFEVYGSVEKIDNIAFRQCYKLKKFVCHGSVKHIGKLAFYGDYRLEKLSLGKNIQSIGEAAFEECNRIKRPRVKKK